MLILPEVSLLGKILANPINMQIYSGIIGETEKMGLDFMPVSENYFFQVFPENNQRIGFFVLQELSPLVSEMLKEKKLSLVLLNPPMEDPRCLSVRLDRRKGVSLAVNHLVSLGHRRIGFVNGSTTLPWYLPRFEGYLQIKPDLVVRESTKEVMRSVN